MLSRQDYINHHIEVSIKNLISNTEYGNIRLQFWPWKLMLLKAHQKRYA